MSFLDDLASGVSALANPLGAIAGNVAQYFIGAQQQKNQMKLAKSLAPMSTLPRLGMGYAAQPVTGSQMMAFNYGAQGPGPYALPATPPGSIDMGPLGSFLQNLGGTAAQGPACSLFLPPRTGPHSRPQQLVMQQNPDTGRMHFWRHVGQPILYSGDVSHCKRVAKILRKSGRRFH